DERGGDQRLRLRVPTELVAQHAELAAAGSNGQRVAPVAREPDVERALRPRRRPVPVAQIVVERGERRQRVRDLEMARAEHALLQLQRALETALGRGPAGGVGEREELEAERVEVG